MVSAGLSDPHRKRQSLVCFFFYDTIKIKYQFNKYSARFCNSMRHDPTVLSADSPHQTKAPPVITGSEGTGGVTARTSFPSRPAVGGTETPFRHCLFSCHHMVSVEVGRKAISRRVYVSVFAFIFQVKGRRCHICPSYEAERRGV